MSPDYEKLSVLLATNKIFSAPAELHGLISGQVSSGIKVVQGELIASFLNIEGPLSPIMEQLLGRLSKEVIEQMATGEFAFQPLLPADDEELGLRIYALGKWCEGFNIGFGGGFGKGDQALLEETREVLSDFAKIAEIQGDLDDDPDDEQNEEDYMELVEYIRMAATTVFDQNTVSNQTNNNLH